MKQSSLVYKNISHCRICQSSSLIEILNFGKQYLSSLFVKSNKHQPIAKIKIPLTVILCQNCKLVQLKEIIDPDFIYRNYFFRSATNPMVRQELKEIARDTVSRVKVRKGDLVLDIGTNDGTILSFFPSNIKKIGIDPALNIKPVELDTNSQIFVDYFSREAILKKVGKVEFKIITSIAMFYSINDPDRFVEDVKSLLAKDGIWCIQVSYLPSSLKTLNFYDICHEHLEYYTLSVLKYLMEKHSLKIFDASINSFNGGSLRLFVTHKSNKTSISRSLNRIIKDEKRLNLEKVSTYRDFAGKIADLRAVIRKFLRKERANNRIVIGLGASTKGNVLLQFFNITKNLLPYISDRSHEKVGLRTLGTDIKIISEEDARSMNPSSMLVLIWPFKEEILRRENIYLEKGGKLLFPMPYPHIVTKNREIKI